MKYQRSMTTGYKDFRIKKLDFVQGFSSFVNPSKGENVDFRKNMLGKKRICNFL